MSPYKTQYKLFVHSFYRKFLLNKFTSIKSKPRKRKVIKQTHILHVQSEDVGFISESADLICANTAVSFLKTADYSLYLFSFRKFSVIYCLRLFSFICGWVNENNIVSKVNTIFLSLSLSLICWDMCSLFIDLFTNLLCENCGKFLNKQLFFCLFVIFYENSFKE